MSKATKKQQAKAEVENAAGEGIMGDPDLDEIVDRMSVFGNNPVGKAALGLMLLTLRPLALTANDEA